MVERFRVVPAAYVLLLRQDPGTDPSTDPASAGTPGAGGGGTQVLLQLRQNTGYRDGHWATAAAGHIEQDESAFEAAVREAREELGIELRSADLLPLTAMHRTAGDGDPVNERVDYFFTATAWTGEPAIQEPDKCADLGWFGLDALPEPVVPHEAVVLDLLRRGDVPAILAHGF
jgi:8-oxo-dGTP pyrophosphatase MutT (NUDIX family)